MRILTIISLCIIFCSTYAQQERKYVRDGNKLYKEGKTNEAAELYAKALTKNNKSAEATYNLGNVFMKQDSMEKAAHQFNTAAQLASDPNVKAKAYHNEGNAWMKAKKYEDAVQAYKNALLNNPKDDDTRYNLAYAKKLLEQDKQKNKDKKKDKGKDDNKDKDKQNGGKDDKDKKDGKDSKDGKDGKDKDQKDAKDDKNGKDQKGDKADDKDQKGKPRQAQLSKEDAQRLLEALKQEEQKVQQKLQEKKGKPQNKKIDKDW